MLPALYSVANAITKSLRQQLFSLRESSYKTFQEALIPGCTNMLGVRIPLIRKISKTFIREAWAVNNGERILSYLHDPDEKYYEEYILKALMIGEWGQRLLIRVDSDTNADSDAVRKLSYHKTKPSAGFDQEVLCKTEEGRCLTSVYDEIRNFIPKITNWGICDTFCAALKITKRDPERMWSFLENYIYSDETYEIRFAVVMYLDYYIDRAHLPLLFERFETVRNTDYYVKMAVAWALSMCFVQFPKETGVFLNRRTIDEDTYKKTIQKICDSRQVKEETKKALRNKNI